MGQSVIFKQRYPLGAMNRLEKEQREREILHPAAMKSEDSRGRAFEEQPDPWRTRFERDRDRVIHSSGFRRLMYKTQVFINHVGDNQRTRMTHSLEVLQVSRSLASVLNFNEPLCETIALAHDLGHPPFGHAGEKMLDRCMADFGGFTHNRQSLRVVDVLERRNPEYRGLNLTHETKESLKKHEKVTDCETGEVLRFPLLEAQLVDLADSTAYHYHDLDDGIREGILNPEQMAIDLPIFGQAVKSSRERHPNCGGHLLWRRAANELLGDAINDICEETTLRLKEFAPQNAKDAQCCEKRLVGHSEEFGSMVADLHKYLYEHLYFREEVNWHVRRATDLLDHLFVKLVQDPTHIPERYHETAETQERAICDYLQGMTDRYVEVAARELGVLPSY
ncbi:MAG: deoxyguanosinetriphosphate triphosphohydrolase [Planctomycetes bacterium]|nr:deoxyguanosinetriphosphate triphosphohydrolase [Planctomycetota bacterium]